MARTLGPIPANRAEREVLSQLKSQLPADWLVVSDVTWALANPEGFVCDGQSDFVVLVPGSGMVIVEVKGSREIWIEGDGRWYRSDRRGERVLVEKSPPGQASSNMYELARIVKEKGGWQDFPGRYSWIVAYPNGIANQVPALFDESTLITNRHMHQLASRIRNALDSRGFGARGQLFTADVVERAAHILTSRPFSTSKADTPLDVQDDVASIEALTRQQFAALRGIFDLPRVAVAGPAGSGKTLLAIWRLRALLESGRRAIYVCFNKDLAALIRKRNPEFEAEIVSVDKFFRDLCPPAGGQASPRDLTRYFREQLPAEVIDLAARTPVEAKYDAIIVDEGQDFGEYQLLALYELLNPESGQWVVFSDRRQDLFKAGAAEEIGAEVIFRLHHNCRNTTTVNDATNRYFRPSLPVDSMPGMPEGVPPTIVKCSSRDAMAARAWELAKQWSTQHGVAILSPYTLANSSVDAFRKGHGLQLTEKLEDLGKPGLVYFSTIRSFKGIESPAVILIDATVPKDSPDSSFRSEDLYVACTRPTARLAILTTSAEAVSWFGGPEVGSELSQHGE